MANLAKLVVSLEAQTAKYQRELKRANNRLARFERTQRNSLRKIARGFKLLVAAVASIQFGRIINQSLQLADGFNKLNDRLGISTEAISELSFVAEQGGIKFNVLELGIQRLQRRVSEAASGTGEAQAALKELNLVAEELEQLPLDKQFEIVAQRLSEVRDDADRTRLAMRLFDSEGVRLIQVMDEGAAGIQRLREEARQLGRSFSKDQVQAATEAKDAINRLQTAFGALTDELVIRAAPALTTFSERLRVALFGTELEQARRELELTLQQIELVNEVVSRQGVADPTSIKIIEEAAAKVAELQKAIAGYEVAAVEANDAAQAEFAETLDSVSKVFNEFEELEVKIKQPGSLEKFAEGLLPTLTFETERDRILRPEDQEDVEKLERSFSLINDEAEKLSDSARDLGFTFQSAFEDAIIEGESLRDVMKGLLDDILRILIRTTVTGPLGDFFGDFFGGIFGRARGGPVRGGQPYIVGERGPELFVPNASGNIVPNGAGGTVNVTTNLNIGGSGDINAATLIPILEENNRKVKAEVLDAFDRGAFA